MTRLSGVSVGSVDVFAMSAELDLSLDVFWTVDRISYICESLVLPTRTSSKDGRSRDGKTEEMTRSGGRSSNDARPKVVSPALLDDGEASNRYTKMHSHNRGFVRCINLAELEAPLANVGRVCTHNLTSPRCKTIRKFVSHPTLTHERLILCFAWYIFWLLPEWEGMLKMSGEDPGS